jgi:hypothetical protein
MKCKHGYSRPIDDPCLICESEMPAVDKIAARVDLARREAFNEAATMALAARPHGMRDAVLERLAEQLMALAGVDVLPR